jgi:hypothetical protein
MRLEFNIDPHDGFAVLATKISYPRGYKFVRMVRKNNKAIVWYEKIPNKDLPK